MHVSFILHVVSPEGIPAAASSSSKQNSGAAEHMEESHGNKGLTFKSRKAGEPSTSLALPGAEKDATIKPEAAAASPTYVEVVITVSR